MALHLLNRETPTTQELEPLGDTSTTLRRSDLAVLVLLASIFLMTCDVLLHGPSNSALFHSVYIDNGTVNTTFLFYFGYLVGGLFLAFASPFITEHKNAFIYSSFAVVVCTIIIRYCYAESNPMVCFVCVFLAALMVPFFKYLFFFDIISYRNTALCVLGLAIGQVGKILCLSALKTDSDLLQFIIFICCGIGCLTSIILFHAFGKRTVLSDTSSLIAPDTTQWSYFFGQIFFITMLTALFQATKAPSSSALSVTSILLSTALYAAVIVVPWYFLSKKENTAKTRFRDAFIFMMLGLLIIIGQSNSTWTISLSISRQLSLFFESYALVVCWSAVAAFGWAQKEKPFTMFGIAILIWCITSILWTLISSHLDEYVSLAVGLLLYLCGLAASKFFPSVRIIEVKPEIPSEREILQAIAKKHQLSEREEEIFMLLSQGRSRQSIASTLYVSEGTVKTHITNIYRKCGVTSKDNLLAFVEEQTNVYLRQ